MTQCGTLRIKLHHPQPYLPTHSIHGTVVLQLTRPLRPRSLGIVFSGHITNKVQHSLNFESDPFMEISQFLIQQPFLYNSVNPYFYNIPHSKSLPDMHNDASASLILEPGEHLYPFVITLPATLPSSHHAIDSSDLVTTTTTTTTGAYDSTQASRLTIHYVVKSILKYSSNTVVMATKRVTVQEMVDIDSPTLRTPLQVMSPMVKHSLFSKSTLSHERLVSVMMQRIGVLTGEFCITVNLTWPWHEEQKEEVCGGTTVVIRQKCVYKTECVTTIDRCDLVERCFPMRFSPLRNSIVIYQGIPVGVGPTSLGGPVERTYKIKVALQIEKWHCLVRLPLVIGSFASTEGRHYDMDEYLPVYEGCPSYEHESGASALAPARAVSSDGLPESRPSLCIITLD